MSQKAILTMLIVWVEYYCYCTFTHMDGSTIIIDVYVKSLTKAQTTLYNKLLFIDRLKKSNVYRNNENGLINLLTL